jgi:hypothetical protein
MTHRFASGQFLAVMAAICISVHSGVTLRADQRDIGTEAQVLSEARFALIVAGVEVASFTRFDSSVDPASAFARVMTLSGGQKYSSELAAWHELVLGDINGARKNCTIVMLNARGAPVVTYNITQAWPSKYTGISGLKQLRTEAVMLEYESVEIRVHE